MTLSRGLGLGSTPRLVSLLKSVPVSLLGFQKVPRLSHDGKANLVAKKKEAVLKATAALL